MRISKTEAATDITRNTLKEASEDQRFNWQDERDYDYAQRGLIARAPLIDIRNSQGDVVWGVTAYDNFLGKERPDTIHPSLWRLAKLNNERGLYHVTEGVYQVRGHAPANITVKHNVRAIYDRYLGWYDGNPVTLDPVPPREAGQKMLDYMGGMEAVLKRATVDFEKGNYRWVTQILDYALWAEPEHEGARSLAAKAHTQLGYLSENATWRNAYLSAADELRNGLPTRPSGIRQYDQLLTQITPKALLNVLATHLNGPAAFGKTYRLQWRFTDVNEDHVTYLENAVLRSQEALIDNPDVVIRLTRDCLRSIIAGGKPLEKLEDSGELVITGDRDTVEEFFNCLDDFATWFPVASHGFKIYE